MNRYGELRSDRLGVIEELLSNNVSGLEMRHFRDFGLVRKGEGRWLRTLKFKWLWRPRVSEVVTIFGVGVLILEAYLVWTNYLAAIVRSLLNL